MDSESSTSSSHVEEQSWISWLCKVPGNNFLCEVDRSFIEDSFNLFGLKQMIPNQYYNTAIQLILDQSRDESNNESFRSAEVLYGLIHARFIISGAGLLAMQKKFLQKEFGECPRACCEGQGVLPIGISEETGTMPVKLFCPRCRDIFNSLPAQRHIDGAYFGSTFAHIFLMTFEDTVPRAPSSHYVPKIFGFKIHPTSNSIPKPSKTKTIAFTVSKPTEDAASDEEKDKAQPVAKKARKN